MATLHLPLKACYFDQIKAGDKTTEYRLVTPFWSRRLLFRRYDQIELTSGYPSRHDTERRLVRPWRGFSVEIIQHPHFGTEPVTVFAIPVQP